EILGAAAGREPSERGSILLPGGAAGPHRPGRAGDRLVPQAARSGPDARRALADPGALPRPAGPGRPRPRGAGDGRGAEDAALRVVPGNVPALRPLTRCASKGPSWPDARVRRCLIDAGPEPRPRGRRTRPGPAVPGPLRTNPLPALAARCAADGG